MLTKARTRKSKACKPAQMPTESESQTDSKCPPAAFTPAQRRRMRALFALRHERTLTTAEQEELNRLVDAEWDAAIARGIRKVLAAHPELVDGQGNLNVPLVDALLREKYAAATTSLKRSERAHDTKESSPADTP
jgi:hypothetical protein